MAPIRLPARLRAGETENIAAHVHYLICHEVCIPGQKQLMLSLPVQNRLVASLSRELFATARARVPKPKPRSWKISAASLGDEFVLNLQTEELTKMLQFFPFHAEQIENAASQEMTVFPGGVRLHLKKSNHLLKPIARLQGVIVLDSEKAKPQDGFGPEATAHVEMSASGNAPPSSGFSTTARLARSFPIAFSGHTGPPIDQKQVVVVPFLVQETGHLATGHSG
jgi:thiol:disulfide interchange protein DsbD